MSQIIKLEHKVIRLRTTEGLAKLLDDMSAEGWKYKTNIGGAMVFDRLPQEPKKKPSELNPDPKKNEGKSKTETPKEKPKEDK